MTIVEHSVSFPSLFLLILRLELVHGSLLSCGYAAHHSFVQALCLLTIIYLVLGM